MLKKLSIIVLSVLLLVFCASCSKNEIKDDVKNAEQKIIKTSDEAVKKVSDLAEKVKVDAKDTVSDIRKNVEMVKKDIEENGEKMKSESVDMYQNRQASAALMEDAVSKIEQAQKEGNEALLEEGRQLLRMAQSLWDYTE